MLTKKTKKIIYFTVFYTIGLLFAYWLYTLKTPVLAASKENFTSVSSGIISDTNNIWAVCNVGSGRASNTSNAYLIKMSFSDKDKLSVVTNFGISSGSYIQNLLSFGSTVWASDYYNAAVRILNPSNGVIIQNVQVGSGPTGMAFDGTNVWVCNYSDSTCTVIDEGDGSIVSTVNVGRQPTCVLFDSQYIWVSCGVGEIYVIDPSNFSIKNKFSPGIQLTRLTTLNNSVYALGTNQSQNVGLYFLLQMNANGIQSTISLAQSSGGSDIYMDLTNDGKNIYVLSVGGNVLCVKSDGTFINDFPVGSNIQGNFINIIEGKVFVLDTTNNNVAVSTTDGGNIVSQLSTIVSI